MNADLKYFELTQKIIGIYYDVYNELGSGFLESVYQKSLALAHESAGLRVFSHIGIPVRFRGRQVGQFERDVVGEKCVLLEWRAARVLGSAHQAQLMNYLRATEIEVGLLLNFRPQREFKRVAYDNIRKKIR